MNLLYSDERETLTVLLLRRNIPNPHRYPLPLGGDKSALLKQ